MSLLIFCHGRHVVVDHIKLGLIPGSLGVVLNDDGVILNEDLESLRILLLGIVIDVHGNDVLLELNLVFIEVILCTDHGPVEEVES
jgi:hypothetical protein